MRIKVFFAASAAAALAQAASAAGTITKFDLICEGVTEDRFVTRSPELIERPFTAHLRIDLDSELYCEGECNGALKIHEVTDRVITLQPTRERDHPRGSYRYYLSRIDGQLHRSSYVPPYALLSTEAACQVTEFSGFPPVQRAF